MGRSGLFAWSIISYDWLQFKAFWRMRMINNEVNTAQACTKRRYEVTQADLPLSCPSRDERVWDAHPRVYLPIEETGAVICPYCSAEYILK
jgi:uncharacterized Zn-finger protein